MIEEARAFVTHVQAATGRFPGLYSGHYVKELLGSQSDPLLSKCWFWLSQYGPTPVVPANWPTWTLRPRGWTRPSSGCLRWHCCLPR